MTAIRFNFVVLAIVASLLAVEACAGDAPGAKLDGTWKLTVPPRTNAAGALMKGSGLRLELKTEGQKVTGNATVGGKTYELVGEQTKAGELRVDARKKLGSVVLSIKAKLERDSLKGTVLQDGQKEDFTGRRVAEKNKNILKDRQQQGLR